MMIFDKRFESLTEADLEQLIKLGVTERQNLEYKRQSYTRNDDGVREMLKDISAMGNASGGYIFIGIGEEEDGLPTELVGIENSESERDRIMSSVLANIEPRLNGFLARQIELINKNHVLALAVPRSTRAPHMVNYKGLNQFWIRHDRQKSKMSIDEIRDSFLKTQNLYADITAFLDSRKAELGAGSSSTLCIGGFPLLVKDEFVDIFDPQIRTLISRPSSQRAHGWNFQFNTEPKPTLYGLKNETPGIKTIELFRNGYLEARVDINESLLQKVINYDDGAEHSVLKTHAMIEYPVCFLRMLRELKIYFGLSEPFIVFLSLWNIKGLGLLPYPQNSRPDIDSYAIWPNLCLEVPPVQTPLEKADDEVARQLVDRVWQAFGYERAPLFDEEGNFAP